MPFVLSTQSRDHGRLSQSGIAVAPVFFVILPQRRFAAALTFFLADRRVAASSSRKGPFLHCGTVLPARRCAICYFFRLEISPASIQEASACQTIFTDIIF